MIKRTEAQWRALFSRFDKSKQTAAAFCRENKLCARYFSLRRKQLGEMKTKRTRKTRFSKVKISGAPKNSFSNAECRIILPNGVTVIVPDFSKDQLNELLHSAMQLK